jgi:hypothetical protein
LPIDVTKVIIHHIPAKARTHFHGACSGTVETSPSSFRGFTFCSANPFGEIEGECHLTFQDVSSQMEFQHQKCEEFASIIKLQQ